VQDGGDTRDRVRALGLATFAKLLGTYRTRPIKTSVFSHKELPIMAPATVCVSNAGIRCSAGECLLGGRCRAKREQLETFQGISPESQDRILVLTVLYVSSLLDGASVKHNDSGLRFQGSQCRERGVKGRENVSRKGRKMSRKRRERGLSVSKGGRTSSTASVRRMVLSREL